MDVEEVSGQAPAGWYPDPEYPGRERYWDGTLWTVQRDASLSAAPPPPPPPMGQAPVPAGSDAAGAMGWVKRHKFWSVVIGVFLLAFIGSLFSDEDPDSDEASAADTATAEPTKKAEKKTESKPDPEPEPEPKPVSEYGEQSKQQDTFVKIVTRAKETAEAADNDLKMGAALSERNA